MSGRGESGEKVDQALPGLGGDGGSGSGEAAKGLAFLGENVPNLTERMVAPLCGPWVIHGEGNWMAMRAAQLTGRAGTWVLASNAASLQSWLHHQPAV